MEESLSYGPLPAGKPISVYNNTEYYPEMGSYFLICCVLKKNEPIAFVHFSYRNSPVFSANLYQGALYETEAKALEEIELIKQYSQFELTPIQVSEFYKQFYYIKRTYVKGSLPTIKVEMKWLLKETEQEQPINGGFFTDRDQANQYLKTMKSKVITWYQEKMIEISRIKEF